MKPRPEIISNGRKELFTKHRVAKKIDKQVNRVETFLSFVNQGEKGFFSN